VIDGYKSARSAAATSSIDGSAWQDHYRHSRDGLRLHYRDYWSGADRPAVLCIPGLSRNCRDFDQLAARLNGNEGWRIIAPSLRGRGFSDRASDPSTYDVPTYVDELLLLLAETGVRSVVLIGTSLGARLAMLLAPRCPSLIAGAVLNDLGPELPPRATAAVGNALGGRQACWPDRATAAVALSEIHSASYPRFGATDWLKLVDRLCREDDDGGVSLDYDPAIGEAYRRADPVPVETMWAGFDVLAHRPLLSIRGALSTMLTDDIQSRMAERASTPMAIRTIADVGHAPTLDEPESVTAIEALLKRAVECAHAEGGAQ